MTIEERLAQLERKNRRLTLALMSVGMAAVMAVAMGQGAPAVVTQAVKARSFILVDDDGKVRGIFGVVKGGPLLSMYDENGKGRATLTVSSYGPGLTLRDENGKERATLTAVKPGPLLRLFDQNGKERATLAVVKAGPLLSLDDENGEVLRSLP